MTRSDVPLVRRGILIVETDRANRLSVPAGTSDVQPPRCRYRTDGDKSAAMNILVTGASGLIGSSLIPLLARNAHQVTRLVRTRPKTGAREIFWDPEEGKLDGTLLEGFDAVVHLAGENIGAGRWTEQRSGASSRAGWRARVCWRAPWRICGGPRRFWSAPRPSVFTVIAALRSSMRTAAPGRDFSPMSADSGNKLRMP